MDIIKVLIPSSSEAVESLPSTSSSGGRHQDRTDCTEEVLTFLEEACSLLLFGFLSKKPAFSPPRPTSEAETAAWSPGSEAASGPDEAPLPLPPVGSGGSAGARQGGAKRSGNETGQGSEGSPVLLSGPKQGEQARSHRRTTTAPRFHPPWKPTGAESGGRGGGSGWSRECLSERRNPGSGALSGPFTCDSRQY